MIFMDTINITLNDCHGIKSLKTNDIGFSKTSVCLIYASNGTMKTSFANTFKDSIKGEVPFNKITNITPKINFKIRENGNHKYNKIKNKEDFNNRVFVIESIHDNYQFTAVTKFLANEELKSEFDLIHNFIIEKEDKLIYNLNKTTGIPKDSIRHIFTENFSQNNFLDVMDNIDNNNLLGENFNPIFEDIKYHDLFNDYTIKALNDSVIMESIDDFSNKFSELLEKSNYLTKEFTHRNINDIANKLDNNNFFNTHHGIIFNDNKDENKFYLKEDFVSNKSELIELINNEKEKIFSDCEVKMHFNEIDKKLTPKKLTIFLNIIRDNKDIIPLLKKENIDGFKRNILLSSIKQNEVFFRGLVDYYNEAKTKLIEIARKARQEEDKWNKVINLFNKRFMVPFRLKMSNQEDIVLKEKIPIIQFIYKDDDGSEIIKNQEDSIDFLSSGEKRALYLLNIIYNIECMYESYENNLSETKLLIFDDIADSFDYQNKYAIIEYLNDISKKSAFRLIVLTHNYDFYRIVKSRVSNKNNFICTKDSKRNITFDRDKNGDNLLKNWIYEMQTNFNYLKFISSIPFIRNLVELKNDELSINTFNILTQVLHFKEKTKEITVSELKNIYKEWNINIPDDDSFIYDKIMEESDNIILMENKYAFDLDYKIVLSTAIRLLAEKYIISNLNIEFESLEGNNQTGQLITKYKNESDNQNVITILERVKIMTPENIHMNSFMYEPIIDASPNYLINLYKDIKNIT